MADVGRQAHRRREPRNMHMLVAEVERNGDGRMSLQDETGTFLEVAEPNRGLTGDGVSELDELRTELEEAI